MRWSACWWATAGSTSTRPAAVPEWLAAGDPRRAITLQQLLEMRSGLRFAEDYVDAGVSDVIEMLFGTGQHDVAAFAADFPLDHAPGTVWSYSSGTTNIVSRIVGDVVGGGEAGHARASSSERLFGPLGMASADPRFDDAGTFVGSSFLYATARDFARFGYLYLRDGVWDGRPAAARGLGRPRPHARAGAARGGRSATAPTGGCGVSTRAPSPLMATRASTCSSCPTATWWWCGSARHRSSCAPTSSPSCIGWSRPFPPLEQPTQGAPCRWHALRRSAREGGCPTCPRPRSPPTTASPRLAVRAADRRAGDAERPRRQRGSTAPAGG